LLLNSENNIKCYFNEEKGDYNLIYICFKDEKEKEKIIPILFQFSIE